MQLIMTTSGFRCWFKSWLLCVHVVFNHHLEIHESPHGPLCENMSSTRLEVHNVMQCHQRTKPWPQVTCTKNMVKFSRAVFMLRHRTDIQTDILGILSDRYTCAFSALTLLVGQQEEHPACKKLSGGMLVRLCVWVKMQICICPADATATRYLLLQ